MRSSARYRPSVYFTCKICSARTQQGICPAQDELDIARNSSREDVVNLVRGRVNPITCPCGGLGQWTRVAYLNMSDSTQQCPATWNLISTPVRTCGRSSTTSASCDSAVFPSGGHSYQQVCGRIIAYQIGDPGAFVGAVRDGRNSTEQQYITGLSLTHGAAGARQHIWSFAAYTTQRSQGHVTVLALPKTGRTNPSLIRLLEMITSVILEIQEIG